MCVIIVEFEKFLREILGCHTGHDGSSLPRVLGPSYTRKIATLFNISRVLRELAGAIEARGKWRPASAGPLPDGAPGALCRWRKQLEARNRQPPIDL